MVQRELVRDARRSIGLFGRHCPLQGRLGIIVTTSLTFATNWGWILTAALCAAIGYLLIWERGFYLDDYAEALLARDAVTGLWRPDFNPLHYPHFPVRTLRWVVVSNLQGLLPQQELLVRVICAAMVSANAGLLGWLMYRMVGSRLTAVVTGWGYLLPFWAPEAVLWLAGVAYACGGVLALLFLHCCWNVVSGASRPLLWISLGSVSLIAAILFIEVFVAALVLVPFVALVAAVVSQRSIPWTTRAAHCVLSLVVPSCALLATYLIVYQPSDYAAVRGNLGSFSTSLPSVSERVRSRLDELRSLTISSTGGAGYTADAGRVGGDTLRQSTVGSLLAVAALLALAVTVGTWRGEPGSPNVGVGAALALALFGVAWLVSGVLIPYVPLQLELYASRMLYFSMAGFAVIGGALATLLLSAIGRRGAPIVIALSGLSLLFSAVTMLGHASAFQARSRLDSHQLRAVVQSVPPDLLPPRAMIATAGLDERLFGRNDFISESRIGVFEALVSEEPALRVAYGRSDITAIVNKRWVAMPFQALAERIANGDSSARRLFDLSQRLVVIRFQGDRALPVESLAVIGADGRRYELELMSGRQVRNAGLPTLTRLELDLRR